MPKDEFDFDDPMELSGVALLTEEDTTDAMCECFVEEFMRMGYNHKQVLALFCNPHYLGPSMVLQNRGEQFVRDSITEIFARWGRPVTWPASCRTGVPPVPDSGNSPEIAEFSDDGDRRDACPTMEFDPSLTDPMGAAIPKLNL